MRVGGVTRTSMLVRTVRFMIRRLTMNAVNLRPTVCRIKIDLISVTIFNRGQLDKRSRIETNFSQQPKHFLRRNKVRIQVKIQVKSSTMGAGYGRSKAHRNFSLYTG